MPTIQETVNQIKLQLEECISERGQEGKTSLIRSGKLVNNLHEAIKTQFINNGLEENQIKPPLGTSKGEVKLYGQFKQKKQDIIIIPQNLEKNKEKILTGYHLGETDKFGESATEKILSVNIRTQMSSLDKNFDTLYERTIAEAVNFHTRCPKMCLGEVYLIPVYEYDSVAAKNHKISFSKKIGKLEKYLRAFNQISERKTTEGEFYKYEKVCLLIVDFSKTTPKIYASDEGLKKDAVLPSDSTASINNLTFEKFTSSLLEVYRKRFPNLL